MNQLLTKSSPNPMGTSQPYSSLTHGCYTTQVILSFFKYLPHLVSGAAARLTGSLPYWSLSPRPCSPGDLTLSFPINTSATSNLYPQLESHSRILDSSNRPIYFSPWKSDRIFTYCTCQMQLLAPRFSPSSQLRRWEPIVFWMDTATGEDLLSPPVPRDHSKCHQY